MHVQYLCIMITYIKDKTMMDAPHCVFQPVLLAVERCRLRGDRLGWDDRALVEIGDRIFRIVAFERFADPRVVALAGEVTEEPHAHVVAFDDALDFGDADDDVVRVEDDADITSHRAPRFELPPAGAATPDVSLGEARLPTDRGDRMVVGVLFVVVQDLSRSDLHGDDFGHHRPSVQSTSLSFYQDRATFGHVGIAVGSVRRFDRSLGVDYSSSYFYLL